MQKISRRNFIQQAGLLPAGAILLDKGNLFSLSGFHRGGKEFVDFNSTYDPWLEIDLKNIEWNINQIRRRVGGRPVMAVIKGNAYGHGLVEVGKFLEKIKIHGIAVGKLQEAVELRKAGVKCPILNFGPFSKSEAELIVRNNISQSVYTDNVVALNEAAKKLNKQARVHLKIDTGLGRVGVPYYVAFPFVEKVSKLDSVKIEGIFMTFTEDKDFDKVQLNRFLELCDKAKRNGISVGLRHAASSAAVLAFPEAYLDMVRPGITIYGHYPSDEEYRLKKIQLKPALSLKTRVSYVKKLRPGDSVSYHRKFTATKQETVVTASLGYSDGFPINIIGRASAIINGRIFPLIAAVTANHISVKVTGENDIKIGDEVILIGNGGKSEITAEELAQAANTSVYKILIWMNPLLPRVYKS